MANNIVIDFLSEFLNRLFTKSPKFFKVLQIFFGLLTFASYVPSMLQRWFGVEVPGPTITLLEDIAKYSAGFFAALLLPVKQVPVAQTPEGEAIKVTDEKKMPFTAKAETKAMEEAVPPPPVKDVPEESKDTDPSIETKEISSGMWVAWPKGKPELIVSGSTEKEAYDKAKSIATGTISEKNKG
jgi:hypothetical protein